MALKDEKLYSIREISLMREKWPRRGRRTWIDYCKIGANTKSGSKIKLDSIPVGNRRFTSIEAVYRFFNNLWEADQ